MEYTGEAKELEVLKTSRGKDLLALDGYMFYKNSQVSANSCAARFFTMTQTTFSF